MNTVAMPEETTPTAALAPQTADMIIPILEEKLKAYKLDVYVPHIPALAAFLEAFTAYNANHNLTGETDLARLIERHVVESLIIHSLLPKDAKTLADIGSGGGFPGAIIACVGTPDTKIVLIESAQKKAAFLKEAMKSYPQVTVLAERSNEVARKAEHKNHYDVVTLRAVTELETSVDYALPLLAPNGRIYLCKPKEDFEKSQISLSLIGVKLETYSEYTIEGRTRGIGILRHPS